MKIISVVNQKGGVGKTTTTITVARGLAIAGKKVALIDFDPQGNSTRGFGIDKNECEFTIYELLKKQVLKREYENLEFEKVIIPVNNVDLLPANIRMSKIERELGSYPGKDNFLKKVIAKHMGIYDYILIDCPPSLGMLTDNALTASDEVLIPVAADIYAIEGIIDLLDEIELIKDDTNPNIDICGVVITITDARTQLHKETVEVLDKYFPGKLFKTYIRRSEDVKKAAKDGLTILDYNKSSTAAEDYFDLVKEIIERGDN